ncbi:MAG: hypothetical protein V7784_03780 [Oceanospirillaceae bacterium]
MELGKIDITKVILRLLAHLSRATQPNLHLPEKRRIYHINSLVSGIIFVVLSLIDFTLATNIISQKNTDQTAIENHK